jgi:hypothetical protein
MATSRSDASMLRPPIAHSARLLFGLFAAPLAWAVQLVASYALAASSCFSGGVAKAASAAGIASRLPMLMMAIVCIAIAVAGLVMSTRERRAAVAAGSAHALNTRHVARSRSLASAGILCSTLFLAAIAYSIVMLLMSPQCTG